MSESVVFKLLNTEWTQKEKPFPFFPRQESLLVSFELSPFAQSVQSSWKCLCMTSVSLQTDQAGYERSSRHWVCLAHEKFMRLDWLAAAFEPTVRNYHVLSGRPLIVRELSPFPRRTDRKHNQILSTSHSKIPIEWWILSSSRPGWEGRGRPLQLELQPGRTESAGWWDIFIIKNQFSFFFKLSNLQSLPFVKASRLKQIPSLSKMHSMVGNSSLQFKHQHF